MESVLVELKSDAEKRVLTAFLKSLKMKFKNVSVDKEDLALGKAIDAGKLQGRTPIKQQKEFEQWLNSL